METVENYFTNLIVLFYKICKIIYKIYNQQSFQQFKAFEHISLLI